MTDRKTKQTTWFNTDSKQGSITLMSMLQKITTNQDKQRQIGKLLSYRRFISVTRRLLLTSLLCSPISFAATPKNQFQPSPNLIQHQARNYQMKALCLYNFANFVEWPDEAFNNDNRLKLCLVGRTTLGGFLKTVDGTRVGSKTLEVVRSKEITNPNSTSGCHILYVDIKNKEKLTQLFSNIDQNNMLTVGDQPDFAENWGTVNIFNLKEGSKIEINLKRVYDSGLTMSSDLLGIAKILNYEHAARASR